MRRMCTKQLHNTTNTIHYRYDVKYDRFIDTPFHEQLGMVMLLSVIFKLYWKLF